MSAATTEAHSLIDASAQRRPRSLQAAAGWTLTGLFAAFMAMDIAMKLGGLAVVEETGATLGLPTGSGLPIGLVELAIVALYLIPRTGASSDASGA